MWLLRTDGKTVIVGFLRSSYARPPAEGGNTLWLSFVESRTLLYIIIPIDVENPDESEATKKPSLETTYQ